MPQRAACPSVDLASIAASENNDYRCGVPSPPNRSVINSMAFDARRRLLRYDLYKVNLKGVTFFAYRFP
jgi:hypothetical protein